MILKTIDFNLSKKVVILMQTIIIVTAVALPIIQTQYITPAFEAIILQNSEDEASRVAHHIQRFIITESNDQTTNSNNNETLESHFELTQTTETFLEESLIDFSLWKAKIFNQDGKVLYSSSASDIGTVNTKPYFQSVVAQGLPYTKTDYKNIEHNGKTEEIYLVEVYIPILLSDGTFIGAFELYYDITEREDELIFLTTEILSFILWLSAVSIVLAVIMGRILKQFRLSRISYENGLLDRATTDNLTTLLNRHSIDEYLSHSVHQFHENQIQHCVIMFDVDHFKQVNDIHGHQAGDDVLAYLAKAIKNRLRETDIAGRYGGEEFIIILPKTNAIGGKALAETLRKLIEKMPIPTCAGEINITISLGVGSFVDIEDLTSHTVIKKVDEAMYASKHNGRNQVSYVRT